MSGIKSMVDRGVVRGVNIAPNTGTSENCVGCVVGKSHRAPIPKFSNTHATKPLQLVHSDVSGPIEVQSIGARHFVSFIDDYSKWTVVYFMRRISEVLSCFKRFRGLAEKHTSATIGNLSVQEYVGDEAVYVYGLAVKVLRSDNGGEYLGNDFKQYLSENGIHHQLTVAHTPQKNGVAERMNKTLLDLVRSMLHHKLLPKHFWAEALVTALYVYVRNRVTSRSLPSNVTPYHVCLGKAPDLSHMRVFGLQCCYVLPKKRVQKLDARTREALMMGYSTQSKGYKL